MDDGTDDESYNVTLCVQCRWRCIADLRSWMYSGIRLPKQLVAAVAAPAAPPPVESVAPRHAQQVLFPVRRREETIVDASPTATYSREALNGHDEGVVRAALQRFSIPVGVRAKLFEADIDAVDVLVAANDTSGFSSVVGGVETRVTDRFIIKINSMTGVITSAYRNPNPSRVR